MAAAAGGAGGPAPNEKEAHRMLIDRLSDLTPPVVDHLFGTDTAIPTAEPTFLFLVGAPGVGKSSGHAIAKAAGYLPPRGYATINLDTLLESLTPFRAGSAIGHLLKHKHGVEFSSIQSYLDKQENVGVFKKYDAMRAELAAKNAEMIAQLNTVCSQFKTLKDVKTGCNLISIADDAIVRAVNKSVPIVYETTLSYSEKKRMVEKFENIKQLIADVNPAYKIVVLHMHGEPAAIAERVARRQELVMPFEAAPFYRYVDPSFSGKLAEATAMAVEKLREKYESKGKIIFAEHEVVMDPERLPKPRPFNYDEAVGRITHAYGRVGSEKALSMEKVLEALSEVKVAEEGGGGGAAAAKTNSTNRSRRKRHHSKSKSKSSERSHLSATHKKRRSKSS
jgi:hypothetical protein